MGSVSQAALSESAVAVCCALVLCCWAWCCSNIIFLQEICFLPATGTEYFPWLLKLSKLRMFPCPKPWSYGHLFRKLYSSAQCIPICTLLKSALLRAWQDASQDVLISVPSGQLSYCLICRYKINYSWDWVDQSKLSNWTKSNYLCCNNVVPR